MPSRESIQFLEELQQAVYADLQLTPEMFDEALRNPRVRAALREVQPEMSETEAESFWAHIERQRAAIPTTRWEDPIWYSLLTALIDDIRGVCERAKFPFPELPLFGTLPSGHYNAMTLRVPATNEPVIVFERGLFGWLRQMAKSVVYAIPSKDGAIDTDPERIRQWVRNDQLLQSNFRKMLDATVKLGDPHRSPLTSATELYAVNAAILTNAAEVFVVGHEVAHLVKGHTVKDSANKTVLTSGVEILDWSWAQELEADLVGAMFTFLDGDRQHVPPQLTYLGIDMFHASIDLLETAASTLKFGERRLARFDTHPPAFARRRALAQFATQAIPDERARERAFVLSGVLTEAIGALWDSVADGYVADHANGVPLARSLEGLFA